MRKIKIAQIGTSGASHGKMIFDSLKKQNDVFDIAGYVLCENEREKFPDAVKSFDGYKELSLNEVLNNPEIEAVAVETEEIYLTKYASLCAKNKKHIHMEKPGGMNLPDFEALIDTVKKNNTIFHTGYMYRYNPCIQQLLRQVKNGELGDVIGIEAQMDCIHPLETRKWLETFKDGGMMFFLGCHLIDLILQFQGIPEKIHSFNKASGIDGLSSKDFCMAVFEYKNGVSFVKTVATELGGYARRQFVINGTKKTVELKPFEMTEDDMIYTGKTEYTSEIWADMGTYTKSDLFDRYDNMMSSFAAMVRGEKENPWNYDYELMLYKTIHKICNMA